MAALLILIPAIGYAAVILFLRGGLYRIEKDAKHGGRTKFAPKRLPETTNRSDYAGNTPSFSVVIAARNEERNIRACLQSVFNQDIPPDQYEVIVINDRSNDATPDILRELSSRHQNLKILTITETPPGVSPKKHAVTTGINTAKNEIIVFTDADCRVPPRWLSTIGKYFENGADLVQGITSYKYIDGMNKMFFGLQSLDFLSHGVVAAAAIGANMPINSNANNMAFRKTAFEAIGGYGGDSGVTLGDDDHLLQRFWEFSRNSATGNDKRPSGKIKYMANPHAAVDTAPTETVRALFEQRRRWGSVTVHYGKLQVALLSTVFIFYLTIALTAAASIFDLSYLPIFAALMFVKFCGEFVLMIPGTRIFGKKSLRKYFPLLFLVQLPMILAAVLTGVFGRFDWKGQNMARTTSR